MSKKILCMKGISKAFAGVQALSEVNFDVACGEVHALVGENGAGKSTLMKVLGGVYFPTAGSVELDGVKVQISSPKDSMKLGISIIYQEFNLVPTLSIAENCFLGKERKKGIQLDRKEMQKRAGEVMGRLGWQDIDCATQVQFLSVAQQQMVEIAKALLNDVRVLVMDEPTAVLTDRETEKLFAVVNKLKSDGIAIVYISHRLEEVQTLCDRITVLRDGCFIKVLDNSAHDVPTDDIIRAMVGRDLVDYFPKRTTPIGEKTVLEVQGLTAAKHFSDVNFSLKKGEVLGFSGLVGAGRTEVAKAIFGALPIEKGTVSLEGKQIQTSSILRSIESGILLVPEDRKREGLILSMSLEDNICLPNAKTISKHGVLRGALRRGLTHKYIASMSIRPAIPTRQIKSFSGGNQQKAVIAKWLERNPKVLILDEPTRGVDVGSKAEIYLLIRRLTEQGVSILFISSEMMEIIGMCDRVIVMCEGNVTGEFEREEITQEALLKAASAI